MKRLLLLAALVLFPIPVLAQADRATLTGTVKDQMGAVIPGATVAVTHTGNVFNTVNLGLPDANIANTATVGQIRSLSGDPRLMQFSVRVQF
jgi:hypothetical protein